MARLDVVHRKLKEQGRMGPALRLMPTTTATTFMKERDVILDGPYAETKEHLFSFIVIDVADLDEAVKWAERAPNAVYGSVEIRPLSAHEQDG